MVFDRLSHAVTTMRSGPSLSSAGWDVSGVSGIYGNVFVGGVQRAVFGSNV